MIVTKRKILKTTLMPEYLPRLKRLLGSGFGNLSFLIAIVYNTVRILPDNHPYLHPDKKGQYSIRQVIAEAANHISLSRKNIDQVLVFFSIIAALILFFVQFIILILGLLIPKSYAQEVPANILDFFKTPSPNDDLAFQLLNLVFGIPKFFGGDAGVTEPVHAALHKLFEFYSYGMLIVGTFIILYMVVTTIAETAKSGIPFGQRFNKAWTPIRIALFFALLLPITLGLNSAQYITLASAKLGSGLATQGWILYNDVIKQQNSTLTGKQEQNIAIPKKENLMHLPAFMMVVKTCAHSYDDNYNKETFPQSWEPGITPWALYQSSPNQWDSTNMLGTTYENLIEQSKGRDIHIVFGIKDHEVYKQHRAAVAPICGSIALKVTDVSQPGSAVFRRTYYDEIKSMWNGVRKIDYYAKEYTKLALSIHNVTKVDEPNSQYKKDWEEYFTTLMEGPDGKSGVIKEAVDAQINQSDWQVPPKLKDLGWAGAGIWYNTIAEQNGALVAALRSTPTPMLYPRVMEKVSDSNKSENVSANPLDRYTISYSAGTPNIFIQPYEYEISRAVNYTYKFWKENDSGDNPNLPKTGNAFIDIINTVLGTQGLFDLCSNTDVHPLAQLSAVGKSMLDNSIRAFGGSVLFGLFGLQPLFQNTTAALSEFFGSVASVGLLVGFILFYVLPFMPFIYFFFAVGSWIKTIFEAMVAMPLWALAHLRIDGEGVMGDAAMSGYYLIFEIFFRPILVIFGLIASIVIFAAMVKALNQVFYLVVSNLSGHDPKALATCTPDTTSGQAPIISTSKQQAELKDAFRGPIDEFFFTILYAIVVYMIGTSCFKLIDSIPDNMLRWLDAGTDSFGDNAGNDVEGLMKYVTLGGDRFGQIGQSIKGLGSGAKATTQGMGAAVFSE